MKILLMNIRNVFVFSLVIGTPCVSYGYISDYAEDKVHHECECVCEKQNNLENDEEISVAETTMQRPVIKSVLENGMTVLVYPVHTIPHVSLQIWYNVGSKDENVGEKGIAHLIEHMIFKGTQGKNSLNLSESDINVVTHMLSGSCNAFTAYDYTGYLFNLPSQNWKEALPIMADCMLNASFKDDHLSSELKAVIQELKLRKDNYGLSLAEAMIGAIFNDHPYHYPIIGFKQDLWSVQGKDLLSFYKKHYHPNNATLVVVGDVDPADVIKQAEHYFGHLNKHATYTKQQFYHSKDMISKSITLYRDVQQPIAMVAWTLPGLQAKNKSLIDTVVRILGSGKGSRLYKKLVDEQQLATSLDCFYWDILFEHSLLFVVFEPTDPRSVDKIIALIQQEIDLVAKDGVTDKELERGTKKARMAYYDQLEDTEHQASEIGKYFLATGDEQYAFNYIQDDIMALKAEIQSLLARHCRSSYMHTGKVLPLKATEKKEWASLQKTSDAEDFKILATHQRATPIEQPSYAHKVTSKPAVPFHFPKPIKDKASNGLKLLYYNNATTPKINLELRFKAKDYYDPEDKPGLYNFVMSMITEGTQKYTASAFAEELETRGMALHAYPGGISMVMLADDFERGLELLLEVLTKAVFHEEEIEKVRLQIGAEIKNFWDDPKSFSGQLIREHIYKGHPYSKNTLGTEASINSITRDDLINFYKKYISPQNATLAIVGDTERYDVPGVVEKVLSSWQGQAVEDVTFSTLNAPVACEITHPINRDQVVLCFVAPSIARKHKDFDALQVFDQILSGGVLGSMHSRLFQLREQSGLFYSIGGSLVTSANEQPGMAVIKTLVSLDRVQEAEKAIKNTLKHVADKVTEQEFAEAKDAILNTLMLNFESNASIAASFLFLDRYGFTNDFFDNRVNDLASITIPEMQAAVKRVLKTDILAVFKIGRVEASKEVH